MVRLAQPDTAEAVSAMLCMARRLEMRMILGFLRNRGVKVKREQVVYRAHSALAPEALTMGAQLSYSLFVKAVNSSTFIGTGSAP